MLIGFSVIIFVHELGHFLVARACKVRCPVFSIGMGHRLCGWQKGLGFTFGPQAETDKEEKEKGDRPITATAKPAAVAAAGSTDYRISMLPIGGYVRMLGQDDMDPTKISSDPNSYNSKPIWQRMCIISAGVIMNVIFAVIIFAVVFRIGIDRPGSVIGRVRYNSPAEKAGMHLGDHIIAAKTDDNDKLEFMDILIASALSGGEPVHYRWTPYGGGAIKDEFITPTKDDSTGLLMVGVSPIPDLKFPTLTADELTISQPTRRRSKTYAAAIASCRWMGNPCPITWTCTGPFRHRTESRSPYCCIMMIQKSPTKRWTITPKLVRARRGQGIRMIPPLPGLIPRASISAVLPDSPAEKAGLKSGDVIVRVNETEAPDIETLMSAISSNAGNKVVVGGGPRRKNPADRCNPET